MEEEKEEEEEVEEPADEEDIVRESLVDVNEVGLLLIAAAFDCGVRNFNNFARREYSPSRYRYAAYRCRYRSNDVSGNT